MSAEQPQQQQPKLRIPRAGHVATDVPGSTVSHLKLHRANFRSMGVNCEILTLGQDIASEGQESVNKLDRCWSRFREDSELRQFNHRAGQVVEVSSDLLALLKYSVLGYTESGGLFDPFMGQRIVDLGYDRDFDQLADPTQSMSESPEAGGDQTAPVRDALAPGAGISRSSSGAEPPVTIDMKATSAWIRPGFALDSGGIGKGLGAELVVAELLDQGAAGVLVNLGGDVAVGGSYPDQGWRVGIAEYIEGIEPLTVTLRSGSVCSSGVLKRVWRHQGRTVHHILDPATGEPVESEFVAATAIAEFGWQAEILTKAMLVGGSLAAEFMLQKWSQAHVMAWTRSGELKQFSAATV